MRKTGSGRGARREVDVGPGGAQEALCLAAHSRPSPRAPRTTIGPARGAESEAGPPRPPPD